MIPARLLLVALVAAGVFVAGCTQAPTAAPAATPGGVMEKKEGEAMKKEAPAMEKKEGAMMEKAAQIKAPHFVDSIPGHGGVYAKPPARVLINFDFDLHPNSLITVTKDGADAIGGPTVVGANKLSISALVKGLGDGTYVVNYSACWPDRSCHQGQFSFTVNGSSLAGYQDLRSQSSVTVSMKNIAFSPEKIRVSPGTKVVFVNDDPVEHFVNTDPHPSHNDLPSLNSRGLAQGATYEYTFSEKGEYHYHCSAHVLGLARPMVGVILVE